MGWVRARTQPLRTHAVLRTHLVNTGGIAAPRRAPSAASSMATALSQHQRAGAPAARTRSSSSSSSRGGAWGWQQQQQQQERRQQRHPHAAAGRGRRHRAAADTAAPAPDKAKPDWAGDDLLSRAVNAAISFPPLFAVLKVGARRAMQSTAEQKGVPWGATVEELRASEVYQIKEEVEDKGVTYPWYYTQPFHGARASGQAQGGAG